jgi:O-antigen/teichoic acid export membrane protein
MSMLGNILSTTVSRLINAILALVILLINTNYLGKEGMGTIGLIVLAVTLILLLSNYIGGGALIFLAPRHRQTSLFVPSCIWALIVSGVGTCILTLFNLIPEGFTFDVLILSVLQSFMAINLNLLIGREKIHTYNLISVFQMGVTTLTLVFCIYILDIVEVRSFVNALYAGYLSGFVLSLALIWNSLRFNGNELKFSMIKEILRYGKFIQTANVVQMLNYRLSYYLIEFFTGRAALGLYIVGVQLSEGVWLIGKSVATVQYARISNMTDHDRSVRLTLVLFRFTLMVSLLLVLLLILLPESFYIAILGDEFHGIKGVILSLSPGVLATAASMILSHYYSGTGKPVHNMIGSSLGLIVTLVLGLIFIPEFGIVAAGLTASFSYLVNLGYLLAVFIKREKPVIMDFIIRKNDFIYLKELIFKDRIFKDRIFKEH